MIATPQKLRRGEAPERKFRRGIDVLIRSSPAERAETDWRVRYETSGIYLQIDGEQRYETVDKNDR